MATHAAAADLQGSASVQASLTGVFHVTLDLAGDSSVTAAQSFAQAMAADLVGDSAMTGEVWNLISAALAGDATVAAPASLDAAAGAALAGDATVNAPVEALYGVSTAVQGDGAVVAPSQVSYAAEAALQGDAALSAAAVEDDEMAADLTAGSDLTGTASKDHAAVAAAVGSAVITVVGMVSPLNKAQKVPPSPVLAEDRPLPVKESGKLLISGSDAVVQEEDPRIVRQGTIPTIDTDAASEEARRRRPDQARQSPVVPGSED